MLDDIFFMQEALKLARIAQNQGEVPVGALLVDVNNNIIGQGFNSVIQKHDPSAHAEIMALRSAAILQKNYRLIDTTLYVTLEPCPMCAGALVHARVKRLVFAASDERKGAAISAFNLLSGEVLNHKVIVEHGILKLEAQSLLQDFFKERRARL
jgi:tRNA(adenine34) deaminase